MKQNTENMEDYVKIEKIGEGMYLKFSHFDIPVY